MNNNEVPASQGKGGAAKQGTVITWVHHTISAQTTSLSLFDKNSAAEYDPDLVKGDNICTLETMGCNPPRDTLFPRSPNHRRMSTL